MGQFREKPLPEYVEKRKEKESLRWIGFDSSVEVFPHMNLDWQVVEEAYAESGKPVGDFGSSYSPLATEGELRGINIVSVDLMHGFNDDVYDSRVANEFSRGQLRQLYEEAPGTEPEPLAMKQRIEPAEYGRTVAAAIQKAKERRIVADLALLPLEDRALSIVLMQDALPKHSPDLQTFLEKQLPEILRVTDKTAYIYPMSIYKTWKSWEQSSDPETYGEDVWKEASEMTPEDREEERFASRFAEENDKPHSKLEEADPLYKEPESIEQIAEAARKLGFEFTLEKAQNEEDYPRLGVFRRIEPNKQDVKESPVAADGDDQRKIAKLRRSIEETDSTPEESPEHLERLVAWEKMEKKLHSLVQDNMQDALDLDDPNEFVEGWSIDPRIKELVVGLNIIGVHTSVSCEGHYRGVGRTSQVLHMSADGRQRRIEEIPNAPLEGSWNNPGVRFILTRNQSGKNEPETIASIQALIDEYYQGKKELPEIRTRLKKVETRNITYEIEASDEEGNESISGSEDNVLLKKLAIERLKTERQEIQGFGEFIKNKYLETGLHL